MGEAMSGFQGCGRGRRTLRVTVQVDVQEEYPDEILSPRIAIALAELAQWQEFQWGSGALVHEHDIMLDDGRVAAVRTEAINWYGNEEVV